MERTIGISLALSLYLAFFAYDVADDQASTSGGGDAASYGNLVDAQETATFFAAAMWKLGVTVFLCCLVQDTDFSHFTSKLGPQMFGMDAE